MIEFQRHAIAGCNSKLSVIELGALEKPPLVLLHGTHDHALGMVVATLKLLEDYRIIGIDLRGHGQSDKPGNYTLLALLADLRCVIDALQLKRISLVAHSLGGHVAIRFAAAYPDEVVRMMLLDGMGPPVPKGGFTPLMFQKMWRNGVQRAQLDGSRARQLESIEEARARFRKTNPNLDEDCVRLIVDNGVTAHPDGGLRWCFDSAIDLIFYSYNLEDSEHLAALIECPVMLVTGEDAPAFWHSLDESRDGDDWYESEQLRRQNIFPDARWELVPGAGHMLHYDQPEAVQKLVAGFFR